MPKTPKEVLTEQMIGPSPGVSIDDAEADAIIEALDAAGFVIVPKEPTYEMLVAGARVRTDPSREKMDDDTLRPEFRAMVSIFMPEIP